MNIQTDDAPVSYTVHDSMTLENMSLHQQQLALIRQLFTLGLSFVQVRE